MATTRRTASALVAVAIAVACQSQSDSTAQPLDVEAVSGDATSTSVDVDSSEDVVLVDAAAQSDTQGDPAADTAQPAPDCGQVAVTGQAPSSPVGLPTMTKVVNQDGEAVAQSALTGQWTVMWFYPAASTAG